MFLKSKKIFAAIIGNFAKFAQLALSLLMALVLGTDDHNLAVSLDNLAFIAHRFNRRSYFHKKFLSSISFFLGRKNKFADFKGVALAAR